MNLASVESTNRLTKEGIYKKIDIVNWDNSSTNANPIFLTIMHVEKQISMTMMRITKDYHTNELDICWVINNFNEGGINYFVVDSVLCSSTKPICSCIEINLDEKVAYIFHFLIMSTAS